MTYHNTGESNSNIGRFFIRNQRGQKTVGKHLYCWGYKATVNPEFYTSETILREWNQNINIFIRRKTEKICHEQAYYKIAANGSSSGWCEIPKRNLELQEWRRNSRSDKHLNKHNSLMTPSSSLKYLELLIRSKNYNIAREGLCM